MVETARPLMDIVLAIVVVVLAETAAEYFVLLGVLHLLRRPMDLTFPDGAAFHLRVIAMALVMTGFGFIPCVGGIVGLVAVAALATKFFDGGLLSGGYVAPATFGVHVGVNVLLMTAHAGRH